MVQQLFPDHGPEQLQTTSTQCLQNTARDDWPVTGKASIHFMEVPASTGKYLGLQIKQSFKPWNYNWTANYIA